MWHSMAQIYLVVSIMLSGYVCACPTHMRVLSQHLKQAEWHEMHASRSVSVLLACLGAGNAKKTHACSCCIATWHGMAYEAGHKGWL